MKTSDLMIVIACGGAIVRFDSNNKLGEIAGYIEQNECVILLERAGTSIQMSKWCKILSKYGVVWCLRRRLKAC